MAGTTANYGLWKPDAPDQVRAAQGPLAANFDLIDATLFGLSLLRSIDYTPGRSYLVGQPCFNAGTLLRCITAHTGGSVIDLAKFATISSGGGGSITIDGTTAATFDLTTRYASFLNGFKEPWEALTKGAVTYTPDLTVGNRKVVTNNASGLTVNMPTVANDGHLYGWRLRLVQDVTGGRAEPTWDAKVTWRGLKSTRDLGAGATHFDDYWFETEDNTTWWGYHLSALFSVGANYVDYLKMTAPGTPPANTLREYVDTADDVLKIKDEHGEVYHGMIYASTTAPTNTAAIWLDKS